jgi:hypothetical protein
VTALLTEQPPNGDAGRRGRAAALRSPADLGRYRDARPAESDRRGSADTVVAPGAPGSPARDHRAPRTAVRDEFRSQLQAGKDPPVRGLTGHSWPASTARAAYGNRSGADLLVILGIDHRDFSHILPDTNVRSLAPWPTRPPRRLRWRRRSRTRRHPTDAPAICHRCDRLPLPGGLLSRSWLGDRPLIRNENGVSRSRWRQAAARHSRAAAPRLLWVERVVASPSLGALSSQLGSDERSDEVLCVLDGNADLRCDRPDRHSGIAADDLRDLCSHLL